MREFLVVCQIVYMGVLFVYGVLFSRTAAQMVLHWLRHGPNPQMGWCEALLPVRGRWARYLLAAPLLLVAWAAVWYTAFGLGQVPVPFALVVFAGWGAIATFRKHRGNQRGGLDELSPAPGRCGTGRSDEAR